MSGEVSANEMARLLAGVGSLGFTFDVVIDADDQWRPWSELSSADAVAGVIDVARQRLAGCETRVAVSMFYQGLVARAVSPQLLCLAKVASIPVFTATALKWRVPDDELLRLAWIPCGGFRDDPKSLLTLMLNQTFTVLKPVSDLLQNQYQVPAGLLRGNAAASVVSGLRLVSRWVDDWRELVDVALTTKHLAGGGDWRNDGSFERRSCCLYYRTSWGGYCGDCPLN